MIKFIKYQLLIVVRVTNVKVDLQHLKQKWNSN